MARYEEKKKLREKQGNKENNRKNKVAQNSVSYWFLAPLIAIFSFIPLVVYGHEFDTNLGTFDWYTPDNIQIDYYLYSKMFLLLCVCVYMVVALIYKYVISRGKIQWTKEMIPLMVYGGLTLVSTFVSDNSYFSLHGIIGVFEPVWLLIGYCLIAYYAYVFIQSEDAVRKLLPWFLAGIIIMLGIGIMQAFGHDILQTAWVRKLIIPENIEKQIIERTENKSIFFTIGNRDYVAIYLILIMPILAEMLFMVRKIWQRIAVSVLLVAILYFMMALGMKTAILVTFILLLVMLVLHRKQFKINGKILGVGVFIIVGLFVAISIGNSEGIFGRIREALSLEETSYPLKSIETKEDRVRITYNDDYLDFMFERDASGANTLQVKDSEGKAIEAEFNEYYKSYESKDERFPLFFGGIQQDDFYGFFVKIEKNEWVFSNCMKEGDTSYYAYEGNKAIKLKKEKTEERDTFLEKHDKIANGRGYLWAKTLDIIKNNFWLGTGPDTFLIAFPNQNFVERSNRTGKEYVSSPHSYYLQIAAQTGMPSLVVLLLFFGWYIVDSIRLYGKGIPEGMLSRVGVGIFMSIIGFLLEGCTIDSFNALTAMFYLLIGAGIGINHAVKMQRK